jgi:hypothetical protein
MIESLYKPFQHWSEQGTIWLYSDTHFNDDDDLLVPFPNRPSAEEQVKMINSKVGRKDTLLLLAMLATLSSLRNFVVIKS